MPRTIPIIALLAIAGCTSGSYCDESSPSIAKARALSQDDLAQIYGFVTAIEEPKLERLDSFPNAPGALVSLDPTMLNLQPRSARIYLEACSLDYKVYLLVDRRNTAAREVTLHWGGGPGDWGSEVLWRQSDFD